MLNTIIIIILVLCILLAFVILIQNPKGGGLSSSIGGFSNQTMGVQRTTESLEKASWYLMGVIAFLVLLTGTSLFVPDSGTINSDGTEQINSDLNKTYPGEPRIQQAPQGAPAPVPVNGTPTPAPTSEPSSASPDPSSNENAQQNAAPVAPVDASEG